MTRQLERSKQGRRLLFAGALLAFVVAAPLGAQATVPSPTPAAPPQP